MEWSGSRVPACIVYGLPWQDMEDAKTAVYFYEKCSELARLTGDNGRQMLSNNRLGDVYDKAGDLASAIDYHEKHRELAIAESMRKEVLKANGELVKVSTRWNGRGVLVATTCCRDWEW